MSGEALDSGALSVGALSRRHVGPHGLVRRGYQPGDELAFEPRADFAAVMVADDAPLPRGPMWTLERHGRPRGVGGLSFEVGRHWTGWFYAAELTAREWWFAYTTARQVCRIGAMLGMRIEAAARDGDAAAGRVLRRSGFAPTGEEWRVPGAGRALVYRYRGN
jgi:hypothetical protein